MKSSRKRVLIDGDTRQWVMHRIIKDVRSAFWREASSKRLLGRLKRVEPRAAIATLLQSSPVA